MWRVDEGKVIALTWGGLVGFLGSSNNERREVSRSHSTRESEEGLNNVRHTL